MKKALLSAALLLLALSGRAQEQVKWYPIAEAIQLAAQEPRMLVIDVYTDWCGWCKRMDADTFSDPEVAAFMNKYTYPVKLNAESKADIVIGDRTFKHVASGRRGYHEIAAIVTKGRLSYPTISYVDARGRVVEAVPGYQRPEQFKLYLEYFAHGVYLEQSFEEFAQAAQQEGKSVIEKL